MFQIKKFMKLKMGVNNTDIANWILSKIVDFEQLPIYLFTNISWIKLSQSMHIFTF